MKVSHKVRWLGAGLAAALAVAACTPADNVTPDTTTEFETPVGVVTDVDNDNGSLLTPQATEPLATEPLATEAATEVLETEPAATSQPTEAAMTPEATMEATSAATSAATAQATTQPSGEEQPSVLLSTELVGSQIVDMEGNEVGDVMEILVDQTGALQYLIFDATDYLMAGGVNDNDNAGTVGTQAPEATAGTGNDNTGTVATQAPNTTPGTELNTGLVAVPPSEFMVNTTMDAAGEINEDQVLVFQGTAADLETMMGFDMSVLDQDSFVIDTTDTTLDQSFNGLIRVAELSDWNLVNEADEDLGEVEDLIVDLNQNMVLYGIVDFGGFLGIGEQSTAVPWNLFTIEQTADNDTQFQLNVTQETLEGAPTVDLGAWPAWTDRVDSNTDWNMNWESDADVFWEAAASS